MSISPSYPIGQIETTKVISLSEWKLLKSYNELITVLITDIDENMRSLLSEFLKYELGNNLNLLILTAKSIDELYELSTDCPIDIFIFAFENTLVPACDLAVDRIKVCAQFIHFCKERFKKPIILYSGGFGGQYPEIMSMAKLAADYFLETPFQLEHFKKLFLKCLSSLDVK